MILDVRERCAGGGHAGDLDGGVGIALVDVRGGLRGVFGHVTHAVEGGFAVFGAVNGDQSVKALFRRHLVVAVRTVENVVEAAVRLPEREKIIRQGMTVFHKAAVSKVNSKLAERNNNLRDRFDVRRSPRRIAAFAVLHIGEIIQCLVCCALDRFLVLIFCQRLQCHCGNIHIRIACVSQRPSTVFFLILDDLIDVELARGLCLCGRIFGNIVIAGIQRDQCPNGAVQALPDGLVEVAQRH